MFTLCLLEHEITLLFCIYRLIVALNNPAHHGAAGNTYCIQHSEHLSNEVVDVAEAAVVYSPASATGDLCAVRLAP